MKSLLLTCLVAFLPAGCSTTDCIPNAKMPYKVYDGRVKYYLTDHPSIDEKIARFFSEDNLRKFHIKVLRQSFSEDKALMAYVNRYEERIKSYEEDLRFLNRIREDLKVSEGELYDYSLFGKRGVMSDGAIGIECEEGLLILSHGKVFKKYTDMGSGELGTGGLRKLEKWME